MEGSNANQNKYGKARLRHGMPLNCTQKILFINNLKTQWKIERLT